MSFLVFAAVPTELSGGRYPAPAWAILALGVATLVGALAYLGFLLRRALGRPKPPTSMRPPKPPSEGRR